MAQGTVQFFEEALEHLADGTVDLDGGGIKIALFTNAGAPTFTAADADPAYAVTNEVSGTGYTAGGAAATCTWVEAGGTATFALSVDVTWSQNGAGPTDIYWGLVYDDNASAGPADAALCYIDMGNAANISLQDGDITINAGTLFTVAL